MPLKIITWNINSIRARLGLLQKLVDESAADIVCLQETKVPDDQFPAKAVRKMGFDHIETKGMSAYHGVAILSKRPLAQVQSHVFCGIDDGRHLSAVVDHGGPLQIHSIYVPAGGDVPDRDENPKFGHKLDFVAEMGGFLAEQTATYANLLALGDLNIAPYESDVWSHKQLLKVVSHTPVEVQLHEGARTQAGLVDAVREKRGMDDKIYSWWSYRARDWRASNRGRRLDHVWATPQLTNRITDISHLDHVRDWEKTSDHIPILVALS